MWLACACFLLLCQLFLLSDLCLFLLISKTLGSEGPRSQILLTLLWELGFMALYTHYVLIILIPMSDSQHELHIFFYQQATCHLYWISNKHCPLNGMTLFLKTSLTLVIEIECGAIKLALTWKFHLYYLDFIVLEVAMYAIEGEK